MCGQNGLQAGDGMAEWQPNDMDHGLDPCQVTYPDPPPSTPFSSLIANQTVAEVARLRLTSGIVLEKVPVAYKTWGRLNEERTNCMVVCHALTGSADVEDWWGPLMGPGLVFDPTRYFIFCGNVLGSPYGTASPVTTNPSTGTRWGPEFPATTPRDDIELHKRVLDHLGVRSVAVVVGGSMGGMACLEWPLCTPVGYVRHIVPVATCARHSAWGISWGETQRQSIYSDPKYRGGYYAPGDGPATGLAAARMAALLTYRSRDSFEARFGRNRHDAARLATGKGSATESASPTQVAVKAHNDGHRSDFGHEGQDAGVYSAQAYLRYQGEKFVARFDANCYIHLTRKLDAHDVDQARPGGALRRAPPGALVVAIDTDGLFTRTDQLELVDELPDAHLATVTSTAGHDGFLLEFAQINQLILRHLHACLPERYAPGNERAWGMADPAGDPSPGERLGGEREHREVTNW